MLLTGLVGCAVFRPTEAAPTPPTPVLASVETPDGTVEVTRDSSGVHVWHGGLETSEHQPAGDAPNVYPVAYGGETGLIYNAFVYGLAPAGASSVALDGLEAIGGQVVKGTFVLAIKAKDVSPQQLSWTFRSPAGVVVAQGSNITP